MAVGTVLAVFPGRRRRRPTDPVSAPIRSAERPRAGRRRRPTWSASPRLAERRWLTCSRRAAGAARRPRRAPARRRRVPFASRRRGRRSCSAFFVVVVAVVKSGGERHRRHAAARTGRAPSSQAATIDGQPFDLGAAAGHLGGAQLLRRRGASRACRSTRSWCASPPPGRAARRRRAVQRRLQRRRGQGAASSSPTRAATGRRLLDPDGRDLGRVRRGQGRPRRGSSTPNGVVRARIISDGHGRGPDALLEQLQAGGAVSG